MSENAIVARRWTRDTGALHVPVSWKAVCLFSLLVSVRKHIESLESVVIQGWWPDSRRATDVDGTEPRAL